MGKGKSDLKIKLNPVAITKENIFAIVEFQQSRFLAKALPEPDFRYFSNSKALYLSTKID